MTYKTLLRWQLASIALLMFLLALCVPSWFAQSVRVCEFWIHHMSYSASLRQDSVHESAGSGKQPPLACGKVWPCWREALDLSSEGVLQFDGDFLKRIPNAGVLDFELADPALTGLHISENAGSFRLG